MRLALAAALFAACGLLGARAQDTKDGPADPARVGKNREIQKGFEDSFGELLKKFQDAKTAEERNAVRSEAKELAAITGDKVVKLVEDNPKDAAAFDAARFGLTKLAPLGLPEAARSKLMAAVVAHHLGDPRVGDLVMAAGQMGPAGEKLLRAAAEKAPDRKTKGTALFFLGTLLAEQANDAPTLKGGVEMTDEAASFLEMAARDAGDVKLGPTTIDKLAAEQLDTIKKLGIGRPAPDVTGVGLKDEKTKLGSLKGKVVLLDIWATWCGPCRAMIPHERELVKRMEGKPFALVSVSADEKKEKLTEFLEKEPMPWTHWWNGKDGPILETFRVEAFPTLYLIDAKGVIRKKWVGSPENAVLDKAVDELVREAGATN